MTDLTFGTLPPHTEMAGRSRRWGIWYAVEYQLRAYRAWFSSSLIEAVGAPLLYLLAMGVGLGALIDSHGSRIDGVPYLVFVAPAILITTVTMSVSGEMTFPIMTGFKWNRLYYAPHATALTPGQIALGHFAAVMIRFALQTLIFYLLMLAFGATASPWAWLMVPIGMLTAAAMGAPMMAFAARIEEESGQFALLNRFLLMPMYLFAGTYFPLSVMPGYLRWLGWISPVWHGTQLARVASYGLRLPGWLLVTHVAVLVACAGVGLALVIRQFGRRLGA